MILNDLDLGAPSHPLAHPVVGQTTGDVFMEGLEPVIWARGSIARKQTVSFWIKAWQAIGGQSANTSGALKYLLKQVEELASNRLQQPVYIQWTATADSAALLNASELHDGWYVIENFEPDYGRNVVMGIVECRMTVTQVAPAAPRRMALSYMGGAQATTFSGQAINLLALPLGATAVEGSATRGAGEGSVTVISSPAASPEPFIPSATIANYFKGGVHVYDTINTGSNAVPTTGGTFVNANWVEVKFTDHDFQGDCVITNGLQLLLFQLATNQICHCYLWSTGLATANWQEYATLNYASSLGTAFADTLRSITLLSVGPTESALSALVTSSTTKGASVRVRLQAGHNEVRADLSPLTEATTSANALYLTPVSPAKIAYNSGAVVDATIAADGSPAAQTDYGYAAGFIANSAQPFVVGFLYQNPPGGNQPSVGVVSGNLGLGDTTSLAAGAQRSYGFFAIPYGVNASYSTANLQGEGEGGVLGTGWSSVADGGASAGNTAKCASGTLSGNSDQWATAFVPDPGVYDLWVRMKVTSIASGTSSMQVGLWNSTDSSFVASTTYAPNQLATSYAWYRVAASVTPTATKSMRVRAVTTATLPTDFFMDESALVPKTISSDNRGPQELYQQFAYDRSTRIVRV